MVRNIAWDFRRWSLLWPSCAVAGLLLSSLPATASPAPLLMPPGYVLQETVSVPVNGIAVESSTTLAAGQTYLLRASGAAVVGGPGYGDAEYAFDQNNQALQDNCYGTSTGVDLGIGVDDTDLTSTRKSPFWGAIYPDTRLHRRVHGTGRPDQPRLS